MIRNLSCFDWFLLYHRGKLVHNFLMWIIEHVTDEFVVNAQAIEKITCLEYAVEKLATELRLKPFHSAINQRALESIAHHEEIGATALLTKKHAGEHHQLHRAGTVEAAQKILGPDKL